MNLIWLDSWHHLILIEFYDLDQIRSMIYGHASMMLWWLMMMMMMMLMMIMMIMMMIDDYDDDDDDDDDDDGDGGNDSYETDEGIVGDRR